jgi:hypothetical protein
VAFRDSLRHSRRGTARKLDKYRSDGVYAGTLADNFFSAANTPGYKADWTWVGSAITQTGLCSSTTQYQANDFSVRVRLGADGVLHNVGNVYSKKGYPC